MIVDDIECTDAEIEAARAAKGAKREQIVASQLARGAGPGEVGLDLVGVELMERAGVAAVRELRRRAASGQQA